MNKKILFFFTFLLISNISYCQIKINLDTAKIYSEDNSSLKLVDTKSKLILFLNTYSCSVCIKQLCNFISTETNLSSSSILISRIGYMPIAKRDYNSKISDFCSCKTDNNSYFDHELIEEEDYRIAETGIFKTLNISKTPSIAVLKNNSWYLYKYEELFSRKDGELKSEIKTMLQNLNSK